MIEPVSERTYARIRELTRSVRVAGQRIEYCPCRVLPETVLTLKAVMRELERLWRETLGAAEWERLTADPKASHFFAGEARLVEVQAERPEMVSVWFPVPPDYPGRLKVQLIDTVEPFPLPGESLDRKPDTIE